MAAATRRGVGRGRAARPGSTHLFAAVTVALLWLVAAPTAEAQNQGSSTQQLMDRIDRLQRELVTLQRHVYQSGDQPTGAGIPMGGADVTPTQAARLDLRLSQFEAQVRVLTGEIEEMSYQIGRLSKRLDGLVADVDLRLQQLERGGAVAGAGQPAGPQTAAAGTTPGAGMPAGQAQGTEDPGPKTLGTISAGDLEAFRAQAVEQGGAAPSVAAGQAPQLAALPQGTPKELYDYAFSLLSQANYAEAERALGTFLERYPGDDLAGNAKYWLGETYYVRGQYREAAVAFAEGYQEYPKSSKAPDNLLKLGKSLAALGQSADACGTYAELLKRYPGAPATILQQANSERQRLSCP